MEKESLKFYRYEAVQYATTDYDGEFVSPSRPNPRLELREYVLIKETPKGYWIGIDHICLFQKWVSKTSLKRFAYPTREEALNAYIKRTERRVEILQWQIDSCKYSLETAKSWIKPNAEQLEEIW